MNTISNLSNSSKVYLINGINVSPHEYQFAQTGLNQIIKAPIKSSFNPSNGIFQDLYYSINGLFSNQIGRDLEYQASSLLELELRKDLKAKQVIKIFAHSQGSIILRNVLAKLQNENISLNQIKVFTFGAANYFWPKDLQVFSFTNQSDYLARSLNNLTEAYNNYLLRPWLTIKSVWTDQKEFQKLEFLDTTIINNSLKNPIKAHEWESYLGNFRK